MFERFTHEARAVVHEAQMEARRLGHAYVGTEHLLLGLLAEGRGLAGRALKDHGATLDGTRETVVALVGRGRLDAPDPDLVGRGRLDAPDPDALRSIGIDLDAITKRVEDDFGPGALQLSRLFGPRAHRRRCAHMGFTPKAKKALELSLREALTLGHRHIGCEHVLLGCLRVRDSVAGAVLERCGIDAGALRRDLVVRLSRSA